jgi:hypothetical protein
MWRVGWVVAAALAGLACASGVQAQTKGGESAEQRCAALGGSRFATTPEAPTHIVSARLIPAGVPVPVGKAQPEVARSIKLLGGTPLPDEVTGMPEFCDIQGYVAPQVSFVLRMPTTGWNGKILLLGCGGFCGTTRNMDLPDALEAVKRGYAVTTSDMGHRSTPADAKWAYNNLAAKIDFAHRGTHVNLVAAKAVLSGFYGRAPRLSYFQGCSTGGRQGVMAAQRYPKDFDGIIAGAGPLHYSTSGFQLLWSALANLDADKRPIMKRPDVELLHKAVMAACDGNDGLKDGIIDDPRRCRFDPAVLACRAGSSRDCLSPAKIEVVRKIYQGPLTSKGQPIHMGAAEMGSELNWMNQFVSDDGPAYFYAMSGDKFRYMSFYEDPGPSWEPSLTIDWDDYAQRAQTLGAIFSATNPDLRRFKAAGGKLITYHGWNDQQVTPRTAVDYYETVTRTMGGPEATQSFYRLFMLPGVNHCIGGVGAPVVDYLSALEAWVEKGRAPEQLLGQHLENGVATFSRPYYPYPDVARYDGKGDLKDASSFARSAPP